ncbi:helix-turn-helix domain-containing protein [Actinoplanes rectilineatus]|uniref:helix-turn-helix domain-containing protein n=1 Tax=Actinoplanes rectilineatus TaxID=113571 RepID=UPI001FE1CC89|nr:helix-turn-helix transcriptional regulator [Actinoplanes rectilineatus]
MSALAAIIVDRGTMTSRSPGSTGEVGSRIEVGLYRQGRYAACMPAGQGPIGKRLRLGNELRKLRESKDWSVTHVAGLMGWSHSKVSRLETAKVRPDVGEVMDLLDAYGVGGEEHDRLVSLTREANARGWWRAFAGMPARQMGFAEMESSVLGIREHALVYVPGLLQHPDYIRQRFRDRDAVKDFDLTAAVEGRAERQKILDRGVEYEAVLDEAVLRRRTAPPAVMTKQIRHLIDVASLENVTLRVLRFDAEVEYLSAALNSFALYRFDDPEQDDMVSVESETSDLWLGDLEDLARYVVVFDRLRAAAETPDATLAFLRSLVDEA